MIDITMPKLSDSMEEGTILTWLRQDGEHVEAGEDLVELETDKATMTHAAEASGTLSIVAAEGRRCRSARSSPGWATGTRRGPAAPRAAARARAVRGHSGAGLHAAAAGRSRARPRAGPDGTGARARRSPARRAAHRVSLEASSGRAARWMRPPRPRRAGPRRGSPATAPAPAPPAPAAAKGDVEVVEPTRLQPVIARRMAEVKATVPDFQVQTDVVMDAAIALRAELKDTPAATPSFNDLLSRPAGWRCAGTRASTPPTATATSCCIRA